MQPAELAKTVAVFLCLASPVIAADASSQTTPQTQDPAQADVSSGALVSAPTSSAPAAPASQDVAAAPAESSAPPALATPSTPVDATPAPDAQVASTQGPLLVYVKHSKAPVLIDQTAGSAAFALIGAAAAISSGHSIVVKNEIQDPSGDMARDIALAYAAAHGGRVADAPVPDDHLWTRAKGEKLAEQAKGADLVIDVAPPGMTLSYFPFDWSHYDLMFLSAVRIIDASDGKVIAKARCFLKSHKTPEAKTHSELLADNAAGLKQLINAKSEACVAKMKAELKL